MGLTKPKDHPNGAKLPLKGAGLVCFLGTASRTFAGFHHVSKSFGEVLSPKKAAGSGDRDLEAIAAFAWWVLAFRRRQGLRVSGIFWHPESLNWLPWPIPQMWRRWSKNAKNTNKYTKKFKKTKTRR